ncbi:trifunctional transcriptional regulator/proline dehydrogenase/L-glutamate gamma-semialdehyde dehydrogenase [Methylobacterium soli]|uniref:Bifunctional protein PutA n=1 Tax=Methylobacterium soli TaxID=553447 RepID=A0A6L3STE0_9HYPH|nr:trifunctional transcriptional regulator/proline dehydrogenase/L-glutamate gamma-semialdehyde dehydrogenase [Methylobacterium soli]KAB1073338.1 trifunctional transcriptional regulator/proline dehydrogenase/L-glutamate gamma-semialdehyde dehydrogenase [Methylobacterium soli]GJE43040.1 Bifunctional protein PutA [Methylobacterium soli]
MSDTLDDPAREAGGASQRAVPPETGPFAAFADGPGPQPPLRAAITAAYRRPEPECLPPLLAAAALPEAQAAAAARLVRRLVGTLRAKGQRSGVDGLVREYDLSSQEGVALMCLAEALLRIPDAATRDALIRDKIGHGDWLAHLGHSPSLFVNAATWGLFVTGRLTGAASESGLASALTRLVARGGEPLIRRGVDLAMRMMGEQYITGETIEQALENSRRREAQGFRHSFDMLGEAAMTAADAARYQGDYERAIHAIGRASGGRGLYEGPGISIKLSALHPRYARAQRARVMAELLPRAAALAALARRYEIGLNIDAEEADRLDLSLDILEDLCGDPALAGWDGVGFVVQAYQKRAPFVLDFLIDLARRTGRRLMVRLVKGAYWDSEIKRAQVDGLEDFPVFTRKVHTDVSYLACAAKLLAAPDAVFPQFATHNAQTLAAIHAMGGDRFETGDYEFQCLHGMGEALYEEVVGHNALNRPCRIYAPVGTHETLLAYLVRRLLENGANSSFVHRIADPAVPVAELARDPVAQARAIEPLGAPHPAIKRPRDLYPDRANAAGLDLSNERALADLGAALREGGSAPWRAAPILAEAPRVGSPDAVAAPVLNPADRRDRVGTVVEAGAAEVEAALAAADAAHDDWAAKPAPERAACLMRAAAQLEGRRAALISLLVREAGKSVPSAVAEIREAVDFLRYYAAQASDFTPAHRALGPVLCISPWNFPLAIFTGQVAGALAAGNAVLAKPAEETPLVAAEAVRLLHEAGVPVPALQFLPGGGAVGAKLVADARVRGVMFTGSTEVARQIQAALAERLNPDGRPVPLIAETGGQNALVVDSSALTEQVVADVLASAFDSAGQRCSALRLLCLQEEVADRTLGLLKGAMAELRLGNPDRLATDIGPVISAEAATGILAHVAGMRAAGRRVHQATLPPACAEGSFVPPTVIELTRVAELTREVFGPVLHVVRYPRDGLERLMAEINATGYALTFGVHTRIDETVARARALSRAGNVYVNRNLVGAVVGVQPFGGHGLSGTGPKAGGPLYLRRLLASGSPEPRLADQAETGIGPWPAAARAWADWLRARGQPAAIPRSLLGREITLPGPVGETNLYAFHPRGSVLCAAQTQAAMLAQVAAALATGNRAVVRAPESARAALADLPSSLRPWIAVEAAGDLDAVAAVLWQGPAPALIALAGTLARRPGPIVPIHVARPDAAGETSYPLAWLLTERATSINTSAAGGNASLMALV